MLFGSDKTASSMCKYRHHPREIIKIKNNNNNNKKTRNLEHEVFSRENWIYKSSHILWFYFENRINHTWLNVLKPYDNYVAI